MTFKIPAITGIVRRFMLGVIPFSLGGIILLGVSAFYITKVHISKSVEREVQIFSSGAAASVASYFKQRQNDIETLSETALLADYYNNADYGLKEEAEQYRRELERYLLGFAKRTGAYVRVAYVGVNGREICLIENSKIAPPSRDRIYPEALKDTASVRRPSPSAAPITIDPLYGPVITYSRPVRDSAGNFRGALVLEADLKPMREMLGGLRVGRTGRIFIADAGNHQILAAAEPAKTSQAPAPDFSSGEPIPGTDYHITVLARMSDFDAPLKRIRRFTVYLSVFSCAIVSLLLYFMINALTKPIKKLLESTEELAKNGTLKKVEIENCDEIGALAGSFNSMAEQLTEKRRELEARIRELLVLQGMSAGIIEKLEEENVCRLCLEAAATGIGFERGAFYLINRERTQINGRYVYSTQDAGFTEQQMRRRSIAMDSDDILAEVVRTKKAVIVDNPFEDARVNKSFIMEIRTKTFCLVPVMTKDKVLGIIGADNYYTGRKITRDQMNKLMLFGNFTAIALENAGLVTDVKLSEARYKAVLDNSLDAIVGLDGLLRVTVWNKGAQRLFGYGQEEIVGQLVSRLFEPLTFENIVRAVKRDGFFTDCCVSGISSFGKKLELDIVWAGLGKENGGGKDWTVVIRDTSEQRKMHAQLIQAEKLSAVGQLISSVAHELNNPLGVILGLSEVMHRSNAVIPAGHADDIRDIYEASLRCSDIIKNLLAFVRESRKKRQPVCVADIVTGALALISYKLKKTENILITRGEDPHIPPVMADNHQIGQILVNLIQNACDALSEVSGEKKIDIRTSYRRSSVFIAVSDNGPGMTEEVQSRIFDPFFTTKEEGKGTGLGLAICRRIAEDHGASLKCVSAAGKGTTFTLELPIAEAHKSLAIIETPVWKPVPGKKILVVDDEHEVAGMLKRMLETEDQVVELAFSGPEAIEKIGRGRYDLVICDVEMGAVKGFSVREAMVNMGCRAGFIFTTGNYFNPGIVEKLKTANVPFLCKPFTMGELLLAMCEVSLAPADPKGQQPL